MQYNKKTNKNKKSLLISTSSNDISTDSSSYLSSISDIIDSGLSSVEKLLNFEEKDITIDKNQFINDDFTKLCKNHDYIPTVNDAVKRIVVLGDIHGDYKLTIKLLQIAKVIKYDPKIDENIHWIGGETVVVQVGDQIDRCRPHTALNCGTDKTKNDEGSDIKILKLFTDLHEKAKKDGGKVISLLGNHELMNASGELGYVSKMGLDEFTDYIDEKNPELKFENGEEARRHAFKPGNELGTFLGCTRVSCIIIGSNLFVHAGMLDIILEELDIIKKDDLQNIDILVRKWLLGLINKEYITHIINGSDTSMFWTRILGNIPRNMSNENNECVKHIGEVLKLFTIGSIIIGHTPQSFIHGHGINSVCDDKVWRVDNGSSAAFDIFDKDYIKSGKKNKHREPQVLEIIDDKVYNVLS